MKSQPKHAYFSIALLTFDVNIKKDNFVEKKKEVTSEMNPKDEKDFKKWLGTAE